MDSSRAIVLPKARPSNRTPSLALVDFPSDSSSRRSLRPSITTNPPIAAPLQPIHRVPVNKVSRSAAVSRSTSNQDYLSNYYADERKFRQEFVVPDLSARFTSHELLLFEGLFADYTRHFAPPNDDVRDVDTFSEVVDAGDMAKYHISGGGDSGDDSVGRAHDNDIGSSLSSSSAAPSVALEARYYYTNVLDYRMSYASDVTNVTGYPDAFRTFVNANLLGVTADLQALGVNTSRALPATELIPHDDDSSSSSGSSGGGGGRRKPPVLPGNDRSPGGDAKDLPAAMTTTTSGVPPESTSATPKEEDAAFRREEGGLWLAGIAAGAGLVALLVLVVRYWHASKHRRGTGYRSGTTDVEDEGQSKGLHACRCRLPPYLRNDQKNGDDVDDEYPGADGRPPPIETVVVSNRSWRSEDSGNGGGGECRTSDHADDQHLLNGEALGKVQAGDGMKNLQDEFDRYKDRDLEKLRCKVEENLAGFEGTISAAMTRALIGGKGTGRCGLSDLGLDRTTRELLLWDYRGNPPNGAEVEATVLCEVNNWLQRNPNAAVEQRRVYLQEVLHRMVSGVRHGILSAEDASRTVHESAALLRLSLRRELPGTAVIVSGMRTTVTASGLRDIMRTLSGGGEIDAVAVAAGSRGFGLVRFRHSEFADRVMLRYRRGEVVVQDVPVQIRLITAMSETVT